VLRFLLAFTQLVYYFLVFLIRLTFITLIFTITYTYKLIKSLDTDIVNPTEIYKKISAIRNLEGLAQMILSISLVLKGACTPSFKMKRQVAKSIFLFITPQGNKI